MRTERTAARAGIDSLALDAATAPEETNLSGVSKFVGLAQAAGREGSYVTVGATHGVADRHTLQDT